MKNICLVICSLCFIHDMKSLKRDFHTLCSVISNPLSLALLWTHLGSKAAVVKFQVFLMSPTQLNLACEHYFMVETACPLVTAARNWQIQPPTLTFTSLPGVLISDSLSWQLPIQLLVLQVNDSQLYVASLGKGPPAPPCCTHNFWVSVIRTTNS